MGKERDKLIWSMGGKPSTLSDHEAAIKVAIREAESGDLPPDMLDTLARIGAKIPEPPRPAEERAAEGQEPGES